MSSSSSDPDRNSADEPVRDELQSSDSSAEKSDSAWGRSPNRSHGMEHVLAGDVSDEQAEDSSDEERFERRYNELWADEPQARSVSKMSWGAILADWRRLMAPGPILAICVNAILVMSFLSLLTLVRSDSETMGAYQSKDPVAKELLVEFGYNEEEERGPGALVIFGFIGLTLVSPILLVSFMALGSRTIQQASSQTPTIDPISDLSFGEAIGDSLLIAGASIVAVMPGILAAFIAKSIWPHPAVWACCTVPFFFLFAPLMISTLENGAPFQIFDRRVFESIGKDFRSWVPLLLVSLLATILVAVGIGLNSLGSYLVNFALGILLMIVIFLYFTTVGTTAHVVITRLWRGAESETGDSRAS